MTPVPDGLSPMEQRLYEVSAAALAEMPPELIAESRTLVELDPTVAGIRVHHDGDDVVLTERPVAVFHGDTGLLGQLPDRRGALDRIFHALESLFAVAGEQNVGCHGGFLQAPPPSLRLGEPSPETLPRKSQTGAQAHRDASSPGMANAA